MTALQLGDTAPDFSAESTHGHIDFYRYIDGCWAILFSHPKDFTPVCTTELGAVAKLKPEFDKRKCCVLGLSIDAVDDHLRWAHDIEEVTGNAPNFPLIGDRDLKVAKLYGMIHPNANGEARTRTAADNATARAVFIIGLDKKIKLTLTYPMSTGRDFNEVLRVLDSCQLTAQFKVATPANWRNGEDVIIVPSLNNDDAKAQFPNGWQTVKPYMRVVAQPHS